MAWPPFNRPREKSASLAETDAPGGTSLVPTNPTENAVAEISKIRAQIKPVENAAGGPAFARKAAIEGADVDGLPRAPAFAHSPFTPTRPILTEKSLVGRRRQLDRAIRAVQIERAHLTIFGERGTGKTSFANVLASLAEDAGYGVVRHTCASNSSFGEVFGAVVAKIPPRFLRPVMAEAEAQAFGRRSVWTVATAVAQLEEIRAGHVLILIDEFDRLTDEEAKRDMTELLKTTSDRSVRVSFILIGVAESLDGLMDLHPSLQRTLVSIPLPLLAEKDVAALLDRGCSALRLTVTPQARSALLLLTQGSPYFAQLLNLHASDSAVRRSSQELTLADVASAILLVLEETRHNFEPMLAGLPRVDPRWPDLMFAAACAECNGFGWFTAEAAAASALRQGIGTLPKDLSFGLSVLASPEGGSILRQRRRAPADEFLFSRVNLRNYVLMREATRRKVVSEPVPEHAQMELRVPEAAVAE
jgi:type II secretory pathway predicted ATPase ExeA